MTHELHSILNYIFILILNNISSVEIALFLFQPMDFLPEQGTSMQAPADQCTSLKLYVANLIDVILLWSV